jgi:hypothetical protein
MRHRLRPATAPRRSEPGPPLQHPLAGLPNHALARLLARAPKPDPERTKVKEIGDLDATISAAEWERSLTAGESVLPLYADLATQLGATVIPTVKGTDAKHINGAPRSPPPTARWSASASTAARSTRRCSPTSKASSRRSPTRITLQATFTRLKGEKDAPSALVDAVLSARG